MKTKLVCGVGHNDASYPVATHAVIGGQRKRLWLCPFYLVWANMLCRCYSKKSHAKLPTYIGCSVAPEWHLFMEFRAWMESQDHEGKHLDKDILYPGNKLYGPIACVFVSPALNTFLNDQVVARGNWPIGVYWNKADGKFRAACRNPFTGRQEYLGRFDCPNEAHDAWKARKHQHAMAYADQQTDPRIADALRARYAAQQGKFK